MGEDQEAFELRVAQALIVDWTFTVEGQPLAVGGDDTAAALEEMHPVVAFEVLQAVMDHRQALYLKYDEIAERLGLLKRPHVEAGDGDSQTPGGAPSSSSARPGDSGPQTSPSGA